MSSIMDKLKYFIGIDDLDLEDEYEEYVAAFSYPAYANYHSASCCGAHEIHTGRGSVISRPAFVVNHYPSLGACHGEFAACAHGIQLGYNKVSRRTLFLLSKKSSAGKEHHCYDKGKTDTCFHKQLNLYVHKLT